jgi:hypothetical protein
VLVIDQSEYIEDRPVPGPFPAFPMTKREKPWERGCDATRLTKNVCKIFRGIIQLAVKRDEPINRK